MIASSWAETTIQSVFAPNNSSIPFAAQRTADGKKLVLRAVNAAAGEQPLVVSLAGVSAVGPTFQQMLLGNGAPASADNTPANPTAVSPVITAVPIDAGATSISLVLPGRTFAVLVVEVQ